MNLTLPPPEGRRGTLIALFAGAGWSLAFAPFGLHLLAILLLTALFWSLDGQSPRTALWRGFLFGAGLFAGGTHWVFISIHQFGGLHWSLAGALTLVMIVVLASLVALFAWASVRCLPVTGARRWLLGLPGLWVLVEWVRSWFLTGFPWMSTGYAFTDTWLAGFAPVGGVFMMSLAAAVTAGALLMAVRASRITPVLLIVVIWAGGALLDRVEWHDPAGSPFTVALLQGNIGQDIKWESASLVPTLQRYHDLTRAHHHVDLVVWPEAALPAVADELEGYFGPLADETLSRGAAIVAGMLTRDRDTGAMYNSVITLGAASGVYHKHHLVPFGEFFPVPGFVRSWLRLMNLPYSDFDRGAAHQPPLVVLGHSVAASICYEVAFGHEVARALPEAAVLVNVSNDAWFGDSIAPHQHLQIARMRAKETARWMLRATNTGITAFISPGGDVVARLPQFESGALVAEVQPLSGSTPFVRAGNAPALVLVLLLVLSGLRYRRGMTVN